ncbi:hypothetical protein [Amycolatopsis sp. DSM 110486]|uniref:hypothetical protein n=1 Tax=Amycolatopsis sp. DSM 110486 TaxID=2865832 RepID=UPI001C6A8498|nr:hypothetical protein [Amycolatopsis sp. DSM 110486]QYN17471.1 hypothetical protein K1T34_32310 [Amycolatopsis sp. DSM 110486]
MPTTHHLASNAAPVRFELDSGTAEVQIITSDALDIAAIRIEAEGPQAEAAAKNATLIEIGGTVRLQIPAMSVVTSGNSTTVMSGNGNIYVRQTADVVDGELTGVTIDGDGNVAIGGMVGGGASNRMRISVALPKNADGIGPVVGVKSATGPVAIFGEYAHVVVESRTGSVFVESSEHVEITTQTGSAEIDNAGFAKVETRTGRVSLGTVTGKAVVRTQVGAVRVRLAADARIETRTGPIDVDMVTVAGSLETQTGSIHACTSTAKLSAKSRTGRISVIADAGVDKSLIVASSRTGGVTVQ